MLRTSISSSVCADVRQRVNLGRVLDNAVDLAVFHLDDLIDITRHAQVVGRHDTGPVLLVDQVREGLDDLVRQGGVQAGGRLVGQHHRRLVDQGAGDGHALLLAASWRVQWQNYRENLLIEERMSEFVEFEAVPLQLVRNKRQTVARSGELERRLGVVG